MAICLFANSLNAPPYFAFRCVLREETILRTAGAIATLVIGLAVQARESYAQYYPYLPPRAYPPSAGHLGATGPTEADAGGSGSAQGDTRYMALPPEDRPETGPKKELPPQLRRTEVDYYTKESAGTIIVDTPNTYLYLVLGGGRALRYGIGVGREGFTWTGVENISRMAEGPIGTRQSR